MHLDTVIYEDDTRIIAIPFGRRAPWLVMPTVFGGRLDLENQQVKNAIRSGDLLCILKPREGGGGKQAPAAVAATPETDAPQTSNPMDAYNARHLAHFGREKPKLQAQPRPAERRVARNPQPASYKIVAEAAGPAFPAAWLQLESLSKKGARNGVFHVTARPDGTHLYTAQDSKLDPRNGNYRLSLKRPGGTRLDLGDNHAAVPMGMEQAHWDIQLVCLGLVSRTGNGVQRLAEGTRLLCYRDGQLYREWQAGTAENAGGELLHEVDLEKYHGQDTREPGRNISFCRTRLESRPINTAWP